jgi:hypothetical protein
VEPQVTPAETPAPPPRSRLLCATFAGLGFLVLIVGTTYFAMLVLGVRYGGQEPRATAYYELGKFLSGGLQWYKDARVYGGVALLSALISLLFGVSPLARITIPVAGICYVVLVFYGKPLGLLIRSWALKEG